VFSCSGLSGIIEWSFLKDVSKCTNRILRAPKISKQDAISSYRFHGGGRAGTHVLEAGGSVSVVLRFASSILCLMSAVE
jgi:hypothetical protein